MTNLIYQSDISLYSGVTTVKPLISGHHWEKNFCHRLKRAFLLESRLEELDL